MDRRSCMQTSIVRGAVYSAAEAAQPVSAMAMWMHIDIGKATYIYDGVPEH